MNVFKIDSYYKYMMLAISAVCTLAAALSFYAQASSVELFLMSVIGGIAVFITMNTWSVKVWTVNGFLHKKTLFGCRTLEMALVSDISVMPLRGRYVFMVLTADTFLMLSTMLENFYALKDIVKNNTQESAFAEMSKIDDDQIARKKKSMKLMLAALLVLCIAIVVYKSILRPFAVYY